ncbi:ABC transporter permease [Salipaludibacillus sp. LMS25]|jgi:ABC-2 type transport system permease protein|uniref:ABC transporter permease n=1 Tax=Salipaludibacillus sp. LMS25 TaxID=2924031 RepID=UPI0020D0A557|nr:ABC transporter permease [Salipaludibacillus sp. LMS25]UTR16310.1 ABC transporter permease [Salipaludibacillus sp. LMS25]
MKTNNDLQIEPLIGLDTHKKLSWLREFLLLLRLQFSDYRGNAVYIMIFGVVMPLGIFWVLQSYVDVGPGLEWLVAGNLVMAVCYGSMNFSMQRIAWMRLAGEMDYYGTLPIRKFIFVTVIFTLGLISSVPGMITNAFLAVFVLGIDGKNIAIALPIVLLSSMCLTVFGAAVGSFVKTMPQLNLYFYLSYAFVTFLCPVMIPVSTLPLPLQVTSYLLPPGQAVILVSEVLQGNFGTLFWFMTFGVIFWLVVAATIGFKKMDWRKG